MVSEKEIKKEGLLSSGCSSIIPVTFLLISTGCQENTDRSPAHRRAAICLWCQDTSTRLCGAVSLWADSGCL